MMKIMTSQQYQTELDQAALAGKVDMFVTMVGNLAELCGLARASTSDYHPLRAEFEEVIAQAEKLVATNKWRWALRELDINQITKRRGDITIIPARSGFDIDRRLISIDHLVEYVLNKQPVSRITADKHGLGYWLEDRSILLVEAGAIGRYVPGDPLRHYEMAGELMKAFTGLAIDWESAMNSEALEMHAFYQNGQWNYTTTLLLGT